MDLLGSVKQDGFRVDSRQVKGITCTVTAAVIWVLASFIVQKVEDQGLSPFILSYIANSLFVVFLPLDYVLQKGVCKGARYQRLDEGSREHIHLQEEASRGQSIEKPTDKLLLGYFQQDLLKAALLVAPLWFLAQFTFNTSLHMTSVTSNTILSNASGLFTYALSWAVLQEKYVAHRLVSILVCAAGTSIVALADRDDESRPNSIAGDALCLLSAVFYACYTVAIKRMLGKDEETNTVLFFGYVGLINLVALAPVILLLALTSIISFANLTAGMFGLVVAKGLFDNVLSDYLWARAVLLIGPTTATLGMSLQVPIAVALDIVLQKVHYAKWGAVVLMVLGGWFVLAGFVGITIPPRSKASQIRTQALEPSE